MTLSQRAIIMIPIVSNHIMNTTVPQRIGNSVSSFHLMRAPCQSSSRAPDVHTEASPYSRTNASTVYVAQMMKLAP